MNVAVAIRACRGHDACGDAARHWASGRNTVLCVVDGLGHGPDAAVASQAAVDYVARHVDQPLAAMFSGCNRAIAGTRGVAMGLARIDRDTHAFEYAAVGNTRVLLVDRDQRRYLASSPGIVGGGYRHLCRETGTLRRGARVFLYTDGFPRAIDTEGFSHRLHERDLQRLADALLAGLGTPTDDSAILIYQHPGGAS